MVLHPRGDHAAGEQRVQSRHDLIAVRVNLAVPQLTDDAREALIVLAMAERPDGHLVLEDFQLLHEALERHGSHRGSSGRWGTGEG